MAAASTLALASASFAAFISASNSFFRASSSSRRLLAASAAVLRASLAASAAALASALIVLTAATIARSFSSAGAPASRMILSMYLYTRASKCISHFTLSWYEASTNLRASLRAKSRSAPNDILVASSYCATASVASFRALSMSFFASTTSGFFITSSSFRRSSAS